MISLKWNFLRPNAYLVPIAVWLQCRYIDSYLNYLILYFNHHIFSRNTCYSPLNCKAVEAPHFRSVARYLLQSSPPRWLPYIDKCRDPFRWCFQWWNLCLQRIRDWMAIVFRPCVAIELQHDWFRRDRWRHNACELCRQACARKSISVLVWKSAAVAQSPESTTKDLLCRERCMVYKNTFQRVIRRPN